MKETEVAYLAGLFDGEGCITFEKYGKKRSDRRWSLEIKMTHRPTIDRFAHAFGGLPVYFKPRSKPQCQDQWLIRVRCRKAAAIATALLPYATTKRKELQEVVNYYPPH